VKGFQAKRVWVLRGNCKKDDKEERKLKKNLNNGAISNVVDIMAKKYQYNMICKR